MNTSAENLLGLDLTTLNQHLRTISTIRTFFSHIRMEKALNQYSLTGKRDLFNKHPGVYIEEQKPSEIDCLTYVIGNERLESLIPYIQAHNGTPCAGDIIIYGYDIQFPKHAGIWQKDGTVVSKWGNEGPIIKHDWNKILLDYGNKALFAKQP